MFIFDLVEIRLERKCVSAHQVGSDLVDLRSESAGGGAGENRLTRIPVNQLLEISVVYMYMMRPAMERRSHKWLCLLCGAAGE